MGVPSRSRDLIDPSHHLLPSQKPPKGWRALVGVPAGVFRCGALASTRRGDFSVPSARSFVPPRPAGLLQRARVPHGRIGATDLKPLRGRRR